MQSRHRTDGAPPERADPSDLATTVSDSEATEQHPTDDQRWRLRHWRLLTKFSALLVIPLVLSIALGLARVSASAGDAGDLRTLQRQVELSAQVAGVADQLQHERHLVAAFLVTGKAPERNRVDAQVRASDDTIGVLQSNGVQAEDLADPIGAAYGAVLGQLAGLPALRDDVLTPGSVPDIAIERYSQRVGVLLRFSRLALAGTDASLVDTTAAVDALAEAKEEVSTEHAVLLVAGLSGELLSFRQDSLRQSSTRYDVAITEFTEAAPAAVDRLYGATVNGTAATERERLLNIALNLSGTGSPAQIVPADWDAAAGETADRMRQVEASLLGQLAEQSAALSDQARNDAIRDGVIIAVAVLLALVLLLMVARSVLVPLRTLRTAAFDIAERQLPAVVERLRSSGGRDVDLAVAPVPVDTEEDIGELARAFDAVHLEAVRLAGEQAELRANVNDMFVNLSRRSQGLVERQLQLIDQLEGGERDPEQLAALFRLDHLATRMRRNSENLLVLAGAELSRRGAASVPVVDILRAAASEIEQYQRIVVRPPPGAWVAAAVVNDLVHLVAELLDNATAYAPPDSSVRIAAAMASDKALLIEITDEGVGLDSDQLDSINQRLAEPPRVDVSVSRHMGLFVVGRLADRHGITVRLDSSQVVAGVTAHVRVPAELIGTGGPVPARAAADRAAVAREPNGSEAELFGPALADPDDPLFGSAPPAGGLEADAPIFEEITSAWFRDLRSIPASVREAHGATPANWGSSADEGRRAAAALRAQDNGEVTAAGLPKRRPRALLVPGSPRSDGGAGDSGERAGLNADTVRSRLSSYQRGVRAGRSARQASAEPDSDATDEDVQ